MSRQTNELNKLKGVGAKTLERLHEMRIETAEDLLRTFPADYEYFAAPVPIASAPCGERLAVRACVDSVPSAHGFGRNTVLSFRIRDEAGTALRVTYFHMPYLKGSIHRGEEKVFLGAIRDSGRYGLSLDQPQMFDPEEYEALTDKIRPVYALPAGLSQKRFAGAVREALAKTEAIRDILPEAYLPAGTMSTREALENIHFPASAEALGKARARLVLEEFCTFILRIRFWKQADSQEGNPCPMTRSGLAEEALRKLPYELTAAQQRAFREIQADLAGEKRMNRLLQGDVGSGKTAVALLALLTAVDNGYQGALMAPTEVLAEQHYAKLSALLKKWNLPCRITLLTGSLGAVSRRQALEEIASGEAGIAVGTHALIQEGVSFARLGLVITDEQHRFGVRQRGILAGKGMSPHTLVMSATPIPRTLAIILYGDLDISVLDELPVGRLPIRNAVVTPAARRSAYRLITQEAEKGHRAYIICPLIEAGEGMDGENVNDYAEHLRRELPESVRIGVLHGRMRGEEKNRIMRDFAAGTVQVLVATTVVEVGVDVPEATVMMVENAERFGLAQLHQLRGRVGRGDAQSYAIFVDGSGKKTKNRRLEIMNRSNDGFEIAEEDLKLRGPGDLFGVRQSGEMHFKLGDIYRDHALLLQAAELSGRILQEDPQLNRPEHGYLRENVLQYGGEDEYL